MGLPSVEQHHKPGSAVRVQIGGGHRDNEPPVYLPGVVETVLNADDRDYRLSVRGTGRATGRYWTPCAPECVLPLEAA